MAYENDVYTRNEDSELAVRVVTTTEGTNNSSYDDVFTRDTNGKLAVRVVGAGGGDSHNLGWYATPQALSTAYPTAEDGDYAVVGSTDTVWIWDSDTNAWKDTDTKGQVESVNGQTGVVTLGINDVAPTQTGKSGYVLGTDGFVAGWVKPEIVQVSAMPVASEDEVDNIYQFVGTTDADYTNGYFYKCVSDGQNPATYSWTQTDVQPQASGLPDQTGQSGKFLMTDGTDASWGDDAQIYTSDYSTRFGASSSIKNNQNRNQRSATAIGAGSRAFGYSVALGAGAKVLAEDGVAIGCGADAGAGAVAIGSDSYGIVQATGANSVSIGYIAAATSSYSVAMGANSSVVGGNYGVAVGYNAKTTALHARQIGYGTNSEVGTLRVGLYYNNAEVNYKLLDADGTIPADRLPNAINKYSTMPTAASTNEGWIVQFTGATDSTYTHGYIYECKAQGTDPETYAWEAVEVQAGGGGGLPSQTGNAGKFLTTDGSAISWGDALKNTATGTSSLAIQGAATGGFSVVIGYNASCLNTAFANCVAVGNGAGAYGVNSISIGISSVANNTGCLSIGGSAKAQQNYSLAIGYYSWATAVGAIQLGNSTSPATKFENSDANTFKVGNANGNFEIMSANGTIPTDRFTTTPVADGTYVPTLTISSGVATRTWAAPSGGGGSVPTLTWYSVSTAGNTLTIADTSSAQLVKVYKNGLLLQPTDDYTISGTTLTTVAALVVGDKITTEVF